MFASVIVDINNSEVDRIFQYSVGDKNVRVGDRVSVPFGNKLTQGIVIDVGDFCDLPEDKIKSVAEVIDPTPVLTEETLSLMDFITDNYYVTKAAALRLFLPGEMRKGKVKESVIKFVRLKDGLDRDNFVSSLKKSALKQIACVDYLKDNGKAKLSVLSEKFGASAVKSLAEKGAVCVEEERIIRSPYKDLQSVKKQVILTEKQEKAAESIKNTEKQVSLLFGVTGSGKTEVYLKLIEDVLSQGKTAIMLVPEIALTPQMFKQLRGRFGDSAAILHSGLSAGEKFDEWWRLRTGEAKIAIGARSAIFAPLEKVGLIVIDEEHDGSYSSESSPRYNTVDVACFRANYNGAKLVLGSATPSVDAFLKAQNGEYNFITLPERINKKPLPEVEIADMRQEVRRGNNSPFSSILKEEIKNCLADGNQAIIFLNQRGYSKTVICTECGHVQTCEDCDVSLTYHKEEDALLCHYCGKKYKMVTACTECGSKFLRYGGFGTERVVLELSKLFPQAKILRMDRDTTQNKEGHFEILKKFSEKQADILVGTQMIAKGHDFPSVTLVGILDADMSLHFSDYRSAERTFQLLTQVSGRSGRAEETGKVVLQTYSPENPVLRQAINYDYRGFFEREISIRKATGFPPYTDIVRVLISGENEEKALAVTKIVYESLKIIYEGEKASFRFFGCMKAPMKKLQNKYRFQVLMRVISGRKDLIDRVFEVVKANNSRTVSVFLEINPNNLI